MIISTICKCLVKKCNFLFVLTHYYFYNTLLAPKTATLVGRMAHASDSQRGDSHRHFGSSEDRIDFRQCKWQHDWQCLCDRI